MKAVALTQPFATLVVARLKRNETRTWHTTYIGPLAIHASKGFPRWAVDLCLAEPFKSALAGIGVRSPDDLPTGAIIGSTEVLAYQQMVAGGLDLGFGEVEIVEEPERSFGDYEPGRWAWRLGDAPTQIEPVPFKGQLGLFEIPWPLPATISDKKVQ